MAEFHTALRVDGGEDLLPLLALLQQRGVRCRVFEEGGRQVLKVVRPQDVEPVQELYRAWRAGEVTIELRGERRPQPLVTAINWHSVPVTTALALLSIAGFCLYLFPPLRVYISLFTFVPFEAAQGGAVFGQMEGQYWRLVTPAFLHFGWLHIIFNCLWLWELGSRVERVLGRFNLVMLFLVIAVLSNGAQYAYTGPSLFGGMSGVVYGLLGFAWVAPLLQPAWQIQPSRPIMLFMVGWLVICMLGVIEALGGVAVANAAHLGGLLSGAALGAVFGLKARLEQA